MQQETIAQKALRLLSDVPEEQWIIGRFTDGKGACCAIGHYNRLTGNNPNDFSDNNCNDWGVDFRGLTKKYILEKYPEQDPWVSIAVVNNEPIVNGYTEPVIKNRVIHLLTDMVRDGW